MLGRSIKKNRASRSMLRQVYDNYSLGAMLTTPWKGEKVANPREGRVEIDFRPKESFGPAPRSRLPKIGELALLFPIASLLRGPLPRSRRKRGLLGLLARSWASLGRS